MRKMKIIHPIVLPNGLILLLGLFLFTACGKNNSDQPKLETTDATTKTTQQSAADSIDACSLLTKEEVEKAIGHSVLEPKEEQFANNFSCSYGDAEVPGSPPAVSLSVIISKNSADAKEIHEIAKSNAASVETVSGLGDEAYWDKIVRYLWIVKDKYHISVYIIADVGGLDTAQKLAMKVLGRLP